MGFEEGRCDMALVLQMKGKSVAHTTGRGKGQANDGTPDSPKLLEADTLKRLASSKHVAAASPQSPTSKQQGSQLRLWSFLHRSIGSHSHPSSSERAIFGYLENLMGMVPCPAERGTRRATGLLTGEQLTALWLVCRHTVIVSFRVDRVIADRESTCKVFEQKLSCSGR